MDNIKLHKTRCAICRDEHGEFELYDASLTAESFNPSVFSARRIPDQIHYRMVKCKKCGLVRSNPIADSETIRQLYQKSFFNYSDEIKNLSDTYIYYLKKAGPPGLKRSSLLEIGCGDGFFLEKARELGYERVCGVEPSAQAVSLAKKEIRPYIICDVMRPNLFKEGEFDAICMFQVLDHVSDPATLLNECFRILKKDGFILCITHNIESLSSRLLKERSPVIDIEHTYLYSFRTLKKLFGLYGFGIKGAGAVFNRYTLRYCMHLVPLPVLIKRGVLSFLTGNVLGRFSMLLPLGNMYIIARKPCPDREMDTRLCDNVSAFNFDVAKNKGYIYTTNAGLSSFLANQNHTNGALKTVDFSGKRVIDIGCGDGTYTFELYDRGNPASIHGVDLAGEAIRITAQKIGSRRITFSAENAEDLSCESGSFNIAHVRNALHHANDPVAVLREALRVAPLVIVIEPNGYNLILKLIERLSRYHRVHKERSYAPVTIQRWARCLGAKVLRKKYIGIVPFFCPDWFAKILKALQPFAEKVPFLNCLYCGTCVFVFVRDDARP